MNRLMNHPASNTIHPSRSASRFLLAIAFVIVASTSVSRADIIIDNYAPALHDRFTNDPSFIMSGFDLSGVGFQQSGGAWATAISRNVVISVAHAPPVGVLNFYENNDPNGTPITRTVISGLRVPNTDLYLAVLDSDLPASIVHYSYATEPLSGPPGSLSNAGIYQNLNAYLFGRSPEPHPSFRDQAVGRNRISGYVENVDFQGNTDNDALLLIYDSQGDAEYVSYEAKLQGGDSGGPLFVDIGGQLRLLGTNGFINGAGSPFEFSGINYTGNQAAFINDFINAVPEPSSATLLMIASAVMAFQRRRAG